MTRLQQDRLAALKASTELQARIKAENDLANIALWHAKVDQLKKCVDIAPSSLERLVYQKHLPAHLQTAIAKTQQGAKDD